MEHWLEMGSGHIAQWKVKNYFSNFWVVVVKNGHGTLISE